MLTEKVIELAKEYELTLKASAEDPATLIGARKQYIDFLFDEILPKKEIFDSFSIMGASDHGEKRIVLRYEDRPGGFFLQSESGTVSHYQFAIFQYNHSNYVLLRDDTASKTQLYVASGGIYPQIKDEPNPRIGTGDLELLCRVKGAHYESSGDPKAPTKRVNYDDFTKMFVREITRKELIDPQSCTGYYKFDWTRGRLFDEFYRGLSTFAHECHKKLEPLKGKMAPQDINKAYQALQTLAGRL